MKGIYFQKSISSSKSKGFYLFDTLRKNMFSDLGPKVRNFYNLSLNLTENKKSVVIVLLSYLSADFWAYQEWDCFLKVIWNKFVIWCYFFTCIANLIKYLLQSFLLYGPESFLFWSFYCYKLIFIQNQVSYDEFTMVFNRSSIIKIIKY